jgi:hypothetical protein
VFVTLCGKPAQLGHFGASTSPAPPIRVPISPRSLTDPHLANPCTNHRLTMVSARHTIPHGPQFKLLFNIPIFDSGCLGPAAEGDQPS